MHYSHWAWIALTIIKRSQMRTYINTAVFAHIHSEQVCVFGSSFGFLSLYTYVWRKARNRDRDQAAKRRSRDPTPNQVPSLDPTLNQVPSRDQTPNQVLSRDPTPNKVLSRDPTPNQVLSRDPTPNKVLSRDPTPNKVLSRDPNPNQVPSRGQIQAQAQAASPPTTMTSPKSHQHP